MTLDLCEIDLLPFSVREKPVIVEATEPLGSSELLPVEVVLDKRPSITACRCLSREERQHVSIDYVNCVQNPLSAALLLWNIRDYGPTRPNKHANLITISVVVD